MKTSELLTRLRELNVRLWVDGDELALSAPKGALTPELVQTIKARKQELVELLGARGAQAATGGGAIVRATRRDGLPLSFSQQRLWFLDQLEPDTSVYNMPLAWTLRGPLDVPALEAALAEVVRRHEVLRTSFVRRNGSPVQVVAQPAELALEVLELPAGEGLEARRAEVRRRLSERAKEPFDLAGGELLRPALLRIAPDEHVLFLLVHHIVFDGWSADVFLRELGAVYEARTTGGEPSLAEPELQYGDYASWQRGFLQGEELERMLGYWRDALGGDPAPLDLPTDRPRPAIQTYDGANLIRPLDRPLVDALEALAKREGATLYMVLLAAYQALLARTTGQDEIVVGTVVANRGRTEVRDVIGFFANTLVLRTGLGDDPSFRELLARARETSLGALEHQEMPFEKLVEELAPQRDLSRSPLFQTLFMIEDESGRGARMGDVTLELFELDAEVARADLMVTGHDAPEGFSVWAEYNTDLFDAETIEALLERYETLLREVVRDPEQRLSSIAILSAAERETVLRTWNATQASYPDEAVFRRFERQADRTPDAAAVVFPSVDGGADLTLSYAELDAASNKIAHRLVEVGVTPDALVGLCLERSAEMIVAQLAIQKAGAAYVPLDPSYPVDRLAYMAEDSGLSVVVTQEELRELLPGDLTRVCVDTDAETIAAQSDERLGLEVPSNARMYVIYTSGSTGRPKGVELEHRSVSNFLSSMALEPGLSAGDRLLAVTTLSFDISVLETMLPLMVGGTVIVAPFEAVGDGQKLKGLLARLEPQVMQATPATWRLLGVSGWEGDLRLKVLCGGEALPRELADDLLPRCRELWNVYGPTEATIWSTLKRVEPEVPITIGHPIANTQVYVLDSGLEPCPIGVPGELWIAGDGLARGYLNRPELTAERFLADPFIEGNRMYRTGDLARWTRDGELECLGRIDNQVKLRGFRIELGEIESVLADAEGVRQVVCVVREDSPGDQRLVAYLVPEDGAEVSPDALKAKAGEHLPAYMVPQSFVELSELPHTPNGKVDRNALLRRPPERPQTAAEHVAPRNELERKIAAVWREVLKLDRVSVDTNFFDLGGHSLLLAEVHAKLAEVALGELSIVELFQYPTVSSLAGHLDRAAGEPGSRRQRGRSLAAGRQALMQRRRVRR